MKKSLFCREDRALLEKQPEMHGGFCPAVAGVADIGC